MPIVKRIAPLAGLLVLTGGLAFSVTRDPPHTLPSTLIDRPTPSFALAALEGEDGGLSDQDLKGQVTLLNVFASWCPVCRYEHPMLLKLAAQANVRIVGLNWKDQKGDGLRWLQRNQSPYTRVGLDESGRVGTDLGVTGVPETFVIDPSGRIRYRHPGPLTEEVWRADFEPLLKDLRSGR